MSQGTVPLRELCDVRIGRTPRRDTPKYWGGSGVWVTISELSGGEISDSEEHISTAAIQEVMPPPVPPGTLLFSFKLSIGKMAVASVPLHTNEAIAALPIRDPTRLDRDYLRYALMATSGTAHTNHAVLGKVLNKSKVEALPIPMRSLGEQRRIVDLLSRAENIVRMRKEAEAKAKEIIPALFVDMFGDPATNPRGWPVHTLGDLAAKEKHSLKAGPFGSALKKEFYASSGYKIYGQEQVIRDDLSYGDYYIAEGRYRSLASCRVQAHDLLISLVGTFGRISIVPETFEPGIINPRLIKITLDRTRALPQYVKCVLTSSSIRKQLELASHGGTMGIVNLGILRDVPIPVPSMDRQDRFTKALTHLQETTARQSQASALAVSTFQSLLVAVFGEGPSR